MKLKGPAATSRCSLHLRCRFGKGHDTMFTRRTKLYAYIFRPAFPVSKRRTPSTELQLQLSQHGFCARAIVPRLRHVPPSSTDSDKMGCGASSRAEEPLSALDQMLRRAVNTAKARTGSGKPQQQPSGAKAPRVAKPSFNGLLMNFGKLRPGFLKMRELFQELQPDPKSSRIKLVTLQALAVSTLHIESTAGLDEVVALCQAEGTAELDADQFIVVWTILCFQEPGTALFFPDIKYSLDTLEKAFTYFDSSTDGTLEKGELVAALSSGTRRVLAPSKEAKKEMPKPEKRQYKGAADMLFEVLDLDNSGSITFQEFLLGIVRIVLSDDLTGEDDDLAALVAND